MDKCREEFEVWYEKLVKSKPFTTVSIKDKMLESWMASRESMKAIKLPRLIGNDHVGDIHYAEIYDDAVNECKDAITSAGYKVE